MRIRCRCGLETRVDASAEGRTVACGGCGRRYDVSRDASGKLTVHPVEQAELPAMAWPEDLELDVETQPGAAGPAPTSAPPARAAASMPAAGGLELDMPSDAGRAEAVVRGVGIGVPAAAPAQPVPPQWAEAPAVQRSWWHYLADSWSYPFRANLKWALLAWVVLVIILPYLMIVFSLMPLIGPLVGLIVSLVMWGMLILWEFEIVRQSAWDAEAKPSLSGYEDFVESALRPVGQFLCALSVSILPLVAAVVAFLMTLGPEGQHQASEGWFILLMGLLFYAVVAPLALLQGALSPDMLATVTAGKAWWLLGGMVAFALLMPITLLAVGTADSIKGVNPRFTLPALSRIIGPYLVFCVFYWVLLFALPWFLRDAFKSWPSTWAGLVLGVYLLTVCARALGTLHYAYSDRMGWLK